MLKNSQTNYSLKDNNETAPSHHFSLHQVYMTNSDTPPVTSPFYNVQPSSNTSKTPVFPSLPYTTEKLLSINIFKFHSSDT